MLIGIREIHKITLVEVVTEDMLVKKAMENMILEMNTCGLSKHCLIFGSQHYLFGDPHVLGDKDQLCFNWTGFKGLYMAFEC